MIRLHGGRQEGVDLIILDNGATTIRLCPTRGMGIIDATHGDLHLGWNSPVREIVHPASINLHSRGGTGWLEGFNEYLVRCGLEWFGPPCTDTHHIAIGEPPAGNLTLHGKIANIPASEVELIVETTPPHRIVLRSVVHEVAMYGPKYRLTSEIATEPGSNSFSVSDTVENLGGQAQEMAMLYHINHGPPLLEKGSRIVAPFKSARPRDEGYSPEDIEHYDRCSGPRPGAPEQAYLCELNCDANRQTAVVVHNHAEDRAVQIAYGLDSLPHLTLWKGIHHEADGYVLGIEPSTGYPLSRPVEREAGRLVTLKPDQPWNATMTFTLLTDQSAVRSAVDRVRRISRGGKAHA